MSEQREQRCENCRFWSCGYITPRKDGKTLLQLEEEEDNEIGSGRCHRYPPAREPDAAGQAFRENWDFPATFHNDWCGEWQAKEGETSPMIDPVELLQSLSADQLQERLDRMHAEQDALRILYRSARARETSSKAKKRNNLPLTD